MTRDYDSLSDRQANAILDQLYEDHPEVVEAIEATTLIASPLAGPVRILREVDSALGEPAAEIVR